MRKKKIFVLNAGRRISSAGKKIDIPLRGLKKALSHVVTYDIEAKDIDKANELENIAYENIYNRGTSVLYLNNISEFFGLSYKSCSRDNGGITIVDNKGNRITVMFSKTLPRPRVMSSKVPYDIEVILIHNDTIVRSEKLIHVTPRFSSDGEFMYNEIDMVRKEFESIFIPDFFEYIPVSEDFARDILGVLNTLDLPSLESCLVNYAGGQNRELDYLKKTELFSDTYRYTVGPESRILRPTVTVSRDGVKCKVLTPNSLRITLAGNGKLIDDVFVKFTTDGNGVPVEVGNTVRYINAMDALKIYKVLQIGTFMAETSI